MFGHNKGQGGLLARLGSVSAPMGPRQLNLVASEGFSGNGMASIGMDNTFSVIAHMPPPHTVSGYPAVYAAYLVDAKGKSGFFAGTLKPAGNGMYQASFRSPVPLVHYDKVVISLESPQSIMQSPQGPIVMKVKEGVFGGGLEPVKRIGGDVWGRVKGFVSNRIGGNTEDLSGYTPPEQSPAYAPQGNYSPQAANPQQSGYAPQAGYAQQSGYTQQGGYQQPPYQTNYNQAAAQQGGYHPQWSRQAFSRTYRPPQNYRQAYQRPYPQQPHIQQPYSQQPPAQQPYSQQPYAQQAQNYSPPVAGQAAGSPPAAYSPRTAETAGIAENAEKAETTETAETAGITATDSSGVSQAGVEPVVVEPVVEKDNS